MAVLKIRRGLETNRSAFTPAAGEILCASDTRVLYLGDGSTAGGNIARTDAITFDGQLPSAFATAAQGTKADTAHGWGDHSLAGYQLASGMPDALSDFTNDVGFITDYTVTEGDVTAHQAALVLTKSQISDLETYDVEDIEGLQASLDAKLDLAGGTMTGALNTVASDTSGAGFNLAPGVAPTSPANGDMWVTNTNIQVRVNSANRTLAYTNSWATVAQAEAEAGTATTARLWTAQRVNQAIAALAPVKADGTGAAGTWGIGITGNAGSANVLATARDISLTGDVTGTASFDGSGNIDITATVVDDSHNHIISNVDGLQAALDEKVGLTGNESVAGEKTFSDVAKFNDGISLGAALAPGGATDASRHLLLYEHATTPYGLGVTNSNLNVIAQGVNTFSSTVDTLLSKVNHDFAAGIDVTGNITVTGTVDGRDIAVDGAKLDGMVPDAAATANTLVLRDASGYIYANRLFCEFINVTNAQSARTADTVFFSSNGSWLYKNTAAGFKTSLGLGNAAEQSVASAATIRSGAGTSLVSSEGVTASLAWVTLTDATTIAINGEAGINFLLVINGNRTLGNITNPVVGRTYTIHLYAASATPRTLALGNAYYPMNGLDLTNITNTTDGRMFLTITVRASNVFFVSGGRF